MRTALCAVVAALCAALPGAASATTATSVGGALVVTAGPGESNWISLETTSSCGTLPAPCLRVGESPTIPITPEGACVVPELSTFPAVLCPLPASVSVDTGDLDDRVYDWDGPSVVTGGAGNDILEGRGGGDVLDGGLGSDTLIGGPGDDRLAGGQGEDRLEAHLWPTAALAVESAGADVIEGGPDVDTVSYRARDDALSFTVDEAANDGAPGEGDLVRPDVEAIEGGAGPDTMTGDAGANVLAGGAGVDTLRGGAGDDTIVGGPGNDALSGEDGADKVEGGQGDDLVDGGAGADSLLGDWALGCSILEPCIAGADDIRARDGVQDLVMCGAGTDRVSADAVDSVSVIPGGEGCEVVDRQAAVAIPPPAPGPAAGPAPAGAVPLPAACRRLPAFRRAACARLAQAVARCGAVRAGARRAACVRRARAVARCEVLARKPARVRCLRRLRRA